MKKAYILLLISCMSLFLLISCSREKPTAVDSVKAIYDLYILGDTSGAALLGMTEEDLNNAITAYDTALSDSIRSNFSASGLKIEEETIEQIRQARKDALSRMNAEFTLSSSDQDTAVVTIMTTYFDEISLDTDAAYDARDQADEKGFTDYDQYLKFIMETYTANLLEGYQNVTPSEERKEIQVSCRIIQNTWLPEDMAAFGNELGLTVAGQK